MLNPLKSLTRIKIGISHVDLSVAGFIVIEQQQQKKPIKTFHKKRGNPYVIGSSYSRFKRQVGEDCGLGSILKFDFGDDGILTGRHLVPNVISNDDTEAQCTHISPKLYGHG